jgi:hypothetical protein
LQEKKTQTKMREAEQQQGNKGGKEGIKEKK